MINVLVTGVGSNIGQGIIKSLRMTNFKCRIIGTDMVAFSAGLFRCDKGYVIPSAGDERFVQEIIKICKEEKIDIILIGSDPEVPIFASAKTAIEDGCESIVVVSSPQVMEIGFDKWNTYNFLKQEGLNWPHSVLGNKESEVKQLIGECGFPLIVKPRKGAGSKGVFKVNGWDELKYALRSVEEPIVQENLGLDAEEYTSGVFFSKESEIKGIITFKRELLDGTTYRAIIDNYENINCEIKRIAAVLSKRGAIGPINIQTRLSFKETVAFEINPRFSGTSVFRATFGFNEAEAAIRHFMLGEDLGELIHSNGVVMRFWNEVYTSQEELDQLKQKGYIEESRSKVYNLL